jgi:hypothetical protein
LQPLPNITRRSLLQATTTHQPLQGDTLITRAKKPLEKHIASFEAWIPTIKSAILIGQDGAQLKLELAETDVDAALALAKDGRNKVLHVTIHQAKGS